MTSPTPFFLRFVSQAFVSIANQGKQTKTTRTIPSYLGEHTHFKETHDTKVKEKHAWALAQPVAIVVDGRLAGQEKHIAHNHEANRKSDPWLA